MSFYDVKNAPNFVVRKGNQTQTPIQDNQVQTRSPKIIYATVEKTLSGELKIIPMNMDGEGYFEVTPVGLPTLTIDFFLNEPYTKVIGMISFGLGYQVEQILGGFRWTLLNLGSEPYFGTISMMIS